MDKYCRNCGAKLPINADVCIKCGTFVNKKTENSKSKVIAFLFGIFFGIFGVHNFYLGYNGKGISQLLITFLSFGLLSFVSIIWSFIESILILVGEIDKDAEGKKLI